jgi:hypothetical protein
MGNAYFLCSGATATLFRDAGVARAGSATSQDVAVKIRLAVPDDTPNLDEGGTFTRQSVALQRASRNVAEIFCGVSFVVQKFAHWSAPSHLRR